VVCGLGLDPNTNQNVRQNQNCGKGVSEHCQGDVRMTPAIRNYSDVEVRLGIIFQNNFLGNYFQALWAKCRWEDIGIILVKRNNTMWIDIGIILVSRNNTMWIDI
jgi:hypothetical protein